MISQVLSDALATPISSINLDFLAMLKLKTVLYRRVLLTSVIGLLSGCSNAENTATDDTARWYTSEQLVRGKVIFSENCAAYHGTDANGQGEGIVDWKVPNTNGIYPAPPLNGQAHAWHHSLKVLLRTINDGGKPLGGTMPAWKGHLTETQQRLTIAALQDYWPDETYAKWRVIDRR